MVRGPKHRGGAEGDVGHLIEQRREHSSNSASRSSSGVLRVSGASPASSTVAAGLRRHARVGRGGRSLRLRPRHPLRRLRGAAIRGAVLDVARSVDWTPRAVRNLAHQAEETSQQLRIEARSADRRRDAGRHARRRIGRPAPPARTGGNAVLRHSTIATPSTGPTTPRGWSDRSHPEPEGCWSRPSYTATCARPCPPCPTPPDHRRRALPRGPQLRGAGRAAAPSRRRASPGCDRTVEMLREGIEAPFRTAGKDRPKGRVRLRQARYAAAISQHADWRSRLEPTTIPLPYRPGDSPGVAVTEVGAPTDGDEPGVGVASPEPIAPPRLTPHPRSDRRQTTPA